MFSANHCAMCPRCVTVSSGVWVDVARHPDASPRPDVLVVRPEGGLFFANADAVRREVLAKVGPATTAVVFDAQSVPALDVTAAEMLSALREERCPRPRRRRRPS